MTTTTGNPNSCSSCNAAYHTATYPHNKLPIVEQKIGVPNRLATRHNELGVALEKSQPASQPANLKLAADSVGCSMARILLRAVTSGYSSISWPTDARSIESTAAEAAQTRQP